MTLHSIQWSRRLAAGVLSVCALFSLGCERTSDALQEEAAEEAREAERAGEEAQQNAKESARDVEQSMQEAAQDIEREADQVDKKLADEIREEE